jgi:hypothetical protein
MVLHFAKLVLAGLLALTAAEQSPLPVESSLVTNTNATIRIFSSNSQSCSPSESQTTLSIAPETCLQGDYPLHHNLIVDTDPVCANGHVPVLLLYSNRGCTGRPSWNTNRKGLEIPHSCLSGTGTTYWSLIFRCGIWATLTDGGDAYLDAEPPGRVPKDGPAVPALIETHFLSCSAQTVGGPKKIEVPVDRCMRKSTWKMMIHRFPVCANGTRAMWARFPGDKCNGGELVEDGLVDLADSNLGQCLDTHYIGRQEMGSMAFWCDGFQGRDPWPEKEKKEKETTKAKKGSVSDNNCWTKKGPTRASTWIHRDADICWGLRPFAQMYVYSPAICENGTQSLLARYEGKGCKGSPAALIEVTDDNKKKCLPEEEYPSEDSYSWWCSGETQEEPPENQPGKTPPSKSNGNSLIIFFTITGIVILLFIAAPIVFCYFGVIRQVFTAAVNGVKVSL